MKVNVKGLVFVGFAAAILSGAAKAEGEQNIVTSLAYTEDTYQKLSNLATQGSESGNTLNENSDTTYPSEKKVAAALAAVDQTATNAQVKSSANFQVGAENGGWKQIVPGTNVALAVDGTDNTKVNLTVDQSGKQDKTAASSGYKVGNSNGTWADMGSAVTAATNGYISVTGGTSGAAVALDVDASKINNSDSLPANATSANDKLITEYALSQALAAQSTANASDYQPIAGAGHKLGNDGQWETLQAGIGTTVTAVPGANDTPGTVQIDISTAAYDATNTTETVSTVGVGATGNTTYPTTKNVYEYAAPRTTAVTHTANTAAGTSTTPVYIASDGTATAVTVNTDQTFSNVDTSGTGTDDAKLPTSEAVKGYVDTAVSNATGGSTIPAKDTTVCTATYPCALVAEGSLLNWRVMAVGGNQPATGAGSAGSCGNLGDANCDGTPDA